MKILYVDPFAMPGSIGGSQKSLLDVMTEMKNRGNEVILATSTSGILTVESDKRNIKCILFKMLGFKDTRIILFKRSYFNYLAVIQITLSMIVATYSLWRIIYKHKPTIVHSNEMLMSIPVGLASTLSKTPSIAQVRWIPSDRVPRFVIKLYSYLVSMTHKIIVFNSRATQRSFIKSLKDTKCKVIYNGTLDKQVKKTVLTNIACSIGLDQKRKTIGIFGRVLPMKGHHILIDSLYLLKQEGVDFNLLVVGSCDDKKYLNVLQNKINKYALRNIFILGFKGDIENYISLSDILVSPSTIHESFGRTLVEGMSLGKPVVASNVGAHTEIIENGVNGLIVEPDDPRDLAEKIKMITNSKELLESLRKNAHEKFISCFSMEGMMTTLMSIYEKAIQNKN